MRRLNLQWPEPQGLRRHEVKYFKWLVNGFLTDCSEGWRNVSHSRLVTLTEPKFKADWITDRHVISYDDLLAVSYTMSGAINASWISWISYMSPAAAAFIFNAICMHYQGESPFVAHVSTPALLRDGEFVYFNDIFELIPPLTALAVDSQYANTTVVGRRKDHG